MKKQFVIYEIALKLKELGFDEECFGAYDIQSKELFMTDKDERKITSYIPSILCSAPLWQQAIDWIREKHDIDIVIIPDSSSRYKLLERVYFVSLWIYKINLNVQPLILRTDTNNIDFFINFNKAREQAILKAIELCKNS